MKKNYFILFLLTSTLFWSCENNDLSKETIDKQEETITPKQYGEIHNAILEKLMNSNSSNSSNNLISTRAGNQDFDTFMKQLTEIATCELKKYNVSYSQKEIEYAYDFLLGYTNELSLNLENNYAYLINKVPYSETTKKELLALVETNPSINTFVSKLNDIESLEMTRNPNNSITAYSFNTLKEISIASDNFWGNGLQTRSSFGLYVADGLGGFAALTSGVGALATALAGAGASYLYEKAIEPCFQDQPTDGKTPTK